MSRAREVLNEDVYYGDGSVWVTSRRLVYGGEERSLGSVKSVHSRTLRVADQLKTAYIGLPLIVVFVVLAALRLASLDSGNSVLHALDVGLFATAGVVILILGALVALSFSRSRISNDPVYALSVRYRLWSSIATVSADRAYVEQVLGAMQYALAQRDHRTEVAMPTHVGQIAQVPRPVVRGNSVYLGQVEYSLAEIKSIRLWGIMPYRWPWIAQICTMIVLMLLMFAGDFSSQMLMPVMIGGFFVVFPAIIVCAIAAIVSASSVTYAVQLTSNTGARSIVYATKNGGEAKQVEQSIKQEMQGSYAVGQA